MSVTDIILLAIGMFFVVRGLFRGLTGEIFSLLGTAGAFFCAMKFNGTISGILQERLGLSPAIATIITMLGIFFVVFFGCSFLEWTFKKVIEKTKLTATDKFLGAGVGAVKFYVVALFALLMSAAVTPMTGDEWVQDSRVLILTARTLPFVSPALEKAGLMPDLKAIQDEAVDYVLRQAGRTVLGASGDIVLPPPASEDVVETYVESVRSQIPSEDAGQ